MRTWFLRFQPLDLFQRVKYSVQKSPHQYSRSYYQGRFVLRRSSVCLKYVTGF